jgi:hypothetical protein
LEKQYVKHEKRDQFRRDALAAWDHYQATCTSPAKKPMLGCQSWKQVKNLAPPKCRVGY